MALQLDYMWEFLATVEGDCFTCGYVPSNRVSDGKGRNYVGRIIPAASKYPKYISTGEPSEYTAMGASGVTIATGCDLGQTDAPPAQPRPNPSPIEVYQVSNVEEAKAQIANPVAPTMFCNFGQGEV